jgi:hypothetical protein
MSGQSIQPVRLPDSQREGDKSQASVSFLLEGSRFSWNRTGMASLSLAHAGLEFEHACNSPTAGILALLVLGGHEGG